ncbi:MAG: hypothetical protein MUP81_01375 [Dehalococcoidia bacterium]|nr:hypothetical protein [Dehalococcoidia bacterium]
MKIERTVPIEAIINLAIQELSDKYRLDYNTVFAILRDYDSKVARYLDYRAGAEMLFGVN